ncbi:MAG: heat-inducible transcriptional repressor HrcA [Gammaproteobacteria bacterium]|nr:heat-inducible transcriptional repressor HrcA [Gammaproteobacteria bacterium]MDE2345215.1 heat-inducible transcriptional repressor HrcA [Gammaproteobacteria bacterium]
MMTNSITAKGLNERAQHLLKVLVEHYIRDGEPVGSRTLSRDSGLELSPASIRNVMADLEELGFIAAPHTSAGRVPTVKGYRLFVDTLLAIKPLEQQEIHLIQQKLTSNDLNQRSLLASASTMLSAITRMAGVVTLPRREYIAWRHIEFLPLSEHRVLAILVINEGEVQNRILKLDHSYDSNTLQQISNYLNTHFTGKEIHAARAELLNELNRTRVNMNNLMLAAISMAEKVFEGQGRETGRSYVIAGETNLMEWAELSDVEKLRRLFDAFNQQRDILHLLDKCIAADGVQIFIGEESGYGVLDECSVVTAPYSVGDEVVGVLGVIGPTRMAYERVIPIVDLTAKLLGAALNPHK